VKEDSQVVAADLEYMKEQRRLQREMGDLMDGIASTTTTTTTTTTGSGSGSGGDSVM